MQSVCNTWLNTPFSPHAKIKGAGVDCVHIAAEIYRECGVFESYRFPRYAMDGGYHAATSKIIEWVEAHPRFQKVSERQAGDLLCFLIGKTAWHVGVQLSSMQFVHCWQRYGVMISRLDESAYAKRLTAIYRPVL